MPAEIIALLYHYRWTIEIFFRFFKQILGCRHLLNGSQNGIEIQTYCAIIACMLISLWTGRKPTLRTYEMICWYFIGMADLDELLRAPGEAEKARRPIVTAACHLAAAALHAALPQPTRGSSRTRLPLRHFVRRADFRRQSTKSPSANRVPNTIGTGTD